MSTHRLRLKHIEESSIVNINYSITCTTRRASGRRRIKRAIGEIVPIVATSRSSISANALLNHEITGVAVMDW